MALVKIHVQAGQRAGDSVYQESVDGNITRWFELDGTLIAEPVIAWADAYTCEDANPALPGWYVPTPEPPPPPLPVPVEVSKLQLRHAAIALGKWDMIKAALAASPEINEEWELATSVHRDYPYVAALGQAFGWTTDEIDGLFRLAGSMS